MRTLSLCREHLKDCTDANDMDNLELDIDDENVAMSKMK